MAKRQNRNLKNKAKASAVKSDDPNALFKLATNLHEHGATEKAEAMCRRILLGAPEHAWTLNLLGVIHCQTGRGEDGIKLIAIALQHDPEEASFYNNFGTGLSGLGRNADAITAFARALELNPDYAAAHNNIAAPLKSLGKLGEAESHYRNAVRLRPDFAEAWANLANVALDMGKIESAEAAGRKSVEINPDYAAGHNNLGTVLHRKALYGKAEAAFRRAIELRPNYPDALCNLGEVLKEQGSTPEAMEYYKKAWALAPDEADKGGNMLFALCCLADAEPSDIADAHRNWGVTLTEQTPDFSTLDKDTAKRLRLCYVSSDFRRHSVSYFLEPILEHHDKSKFEVFCYANMAGGDEVTARLKRHADHWRDVYGLDDRAMAAQVMTDKIDILVDLSGHTRGGRLPVFALRPAPVQISYLGYPATSGLAQMTGRITDGWADPNGMTEAFHTEKLLRLKNGFLCYRPPNDAPSVKQPPSNDVGYVTFGSFNNLAKLTKPTIELWSEVLKAVPSSRLRLKAKALGDKMTRARIVQNFADHGIEETRLDLMAWITGTSPLGAYHSIDIGLDTFPYHGTTTTMEALWMGVPVVTLAGAWHASRVGVSILARVKAEELIAATPSDYLKIATTLANKPDVMTEFRRHLRSMVVRGGLTDGASFTTEIEGAYQDAWEKFLQ